jgi:hypothetical protein
MPTITLTDKQLSDLESLSQSLDKAAAGLLAIGKANQQAASILTQLTAMTTETKKEKDA